MGVPPDVFYNMLTDDYLLMHKGFINKRIYEQKVMRKMAEIIIAPWVKNINILKIWPLPNDETSKQISEKSMEILKRMRENKITYVKVGGKIVEVINN